MGANEGQEIAEHDRCVLATYRSGIAVRRSCENCTRINDVWPWIWTRAFCQVQLESRRLRRMNGQKEH